MLLESPRPLLTLFDVAACLGRLVERQKERKFFYLDLQEQVQSLAIELFGQARDLWEVRRLLAASTSILSRALRCKQKNFIAHPYCQEFLIERWYGVYADTTGVFPWVLVLLKYLMAPLLLPLFTIQFLVTEWKKPLHYTRLGDYLRMLNYPFFKFFGHTVSFLAFLALLVVVVAQESRVTPSWEEVALGLWVISLVASEAREMRQTPQRVYWRSLWNGLDLAMLSLFVIVMALRAFIYLEPSFVDQENWLRVANHLLAYAALCASMRLLNVMQSHHLLGPLQVSCGSVLRLITIMQISIQHMVRDLAVFWIVLVVYVFGFALAMTKVPL